MMNEFKAGSFVVATAGHDANNCFVIIRIDSEYVYLVDGRIRTIDQPKKKKTIHVRMLDIFDHTLTDKIINNTVKNEEIKRAIKLLQYGNSSKEVE